MIGGLIFKHLEKDHFHVSDGKGELSDSVVKINKAFMEKALSHIPNIKKMKKKDMLPMFIRYTQHNHHFKRLPRKNKEPFYQDLDTNLLYDHNDRHIGHVTESPFGHAVYHLTHEYKKEQKLNGK